MSSVLRMRSTYREEADSGETVISLRNGEVCQVTLQKSRPFSAGRPASWK